MNNNRGFLQLLAACPAYQRQFLLKTATPQQLHALVQVLYNLLMGHIPISEENKRVLLPYTDALLNLASPNVPFKTKKRVLVQEGSGFIEDVLAPVVSSLGQLLRNKPTISVTNIAELVEYVLLPHNNDVTKPCEYVSKWTCRVRSR